jgi:hypothetical protein
LICLMIYTRLSQSEREIIAREPAKESSYTDIA